MGGKQSALVIDVDAFAIPVQQRANGEPMPEVMHARSRTNAGTPRTNLRSSDVHQVDGLNDCPPTGKSVERLRISGLSMVALTTSFARCDFIFGVSGLLLKAVEDYQDNRHSQTNVADHPKKRWRVLIVCWPIRLFD